MQQSHEDRAQDRDSSILPDALGVGKRQSEDAACPQHYQVDGDERLDRTAAQMSGPCDSTKPEYYIIFLMLKHFGIVLNYKIIKIPIPMAAIIIIHQIIFTTTTRKIRTGHDVG